jgi:hypothetical protein
MDWLQFIAAIIGHLAWPAVVLILLVMVRKHIGELAERLLEFSFGGAKITFDKILEKGREIIEHAPLPEPQIAEDQPELELPDAVPEFKEGRSKRISSLPNRRRKRTEIFYRSALAQVVDGLQEVDQLLFGIGDKLGIDAASASSVLYSLAASNVVQQEIVDLYDTLRDARNLLSHAQVHPDRIEAVEYMRQANYLLWTLKAVKDKVTSGEIKL